MHIRLVVDGKKQELEVDLAGGEARLDGRNVPFRVVEQTGSRTEIEVAGERFLVDGWPSSSGSPPGRTVTVNRELYRVEVEEVETGGASAAPRPPVAGPSPLAASSPAPPRMGGGPGIAITPPMPGKVLEVRVKEGESVSAGQVILVLEAMKMRNEIQSPAAGKVAGLTAAAGAPVRAREVLMRIVPG